jgi:ketosteroid isomerase-like protein
MTDIHDTPPAMVERYVAAFNAGDLDALERFYAPDAVLVPVPGQVTADRRGALAYLLSSGQPMRASVKRCFVVGDVALVVVDWAVGELAGTAADVMRVVDGRWCYLVDNPHGTA